MFSFGPRHTVEVFDIGGSCQHRVRYWTKRAAVTEADALASPLYDVRVDGELVHAHVPPRELVKTLAKKPAKKPAKVVAKKPAKVVAKKPAKVVAKKPPTRGS